jgi:hypothetical protein
MHRKTISAERVIALVNQHGDPNKVIRYSKTYKKDKFSAKWDNVEFSTDGGNTWSQRQITFFA